MSKRKAIVNALIVNEQQRFVGYVVVDEDVIADVGRGDAPQSLIERADIIDATGKMLLPGAIDTHVHFREPGLTHKATIASESAAAVAGGVTSYLEMPNTKPATVTAEAVKGKLEIASRSSVANYGFFIGATNDNIDRLLGPIDVEVPGIKLFMGSSTGNMLVDNDDAITRLFSQYRGVIAVHAEDEATIAAARARLTAELGDELPVALHSLLRSREACLRATSRAIAMAKRYGTRLHLLHVSTADELQLLSAGDIADKRITAETCPHYLTLTAASLLGPEGNLRKCNPAIKGAADRDALRQAIVDKRIDTIATDHAPHLRSEKQGSLLKAASGMPGVKFMLPLMLDLAATMPELSVERVVELTAHNPARLYDIDRRGFIRHGYYADLVLVEAVAPRTITHEDAQSHLPEALRPGCDWTPYAGLQSAHRVAMTIVNGSVAYDGTSVDTAAIASPLHFCH
jgi:dihydroorotase